MKDVDLTIPQKIFKVPTTVVRDGIGYMGPDVKINAHDSEDAKRRIEKAGHIVNRHFEPTEEK